MRREPVLHQDGARTPYSNPLDPDSSVTHGTARGVDWAKAAWTKRLHDRHLASPWGHHRHIACSPPRPRFMRTSERLEILDEVAPLPLGEREAEALLVMRHDLVERLGAPIVEVGTRQLRRVPEAAQRCGAIEPGGGGELSCRP